MTHLTGSLLPLPEAGRSSLPCTLLRSEQAKVCLAIICHDKAPSPDEVLQHLAREGLSKFDMPEFFAVVSEFPTTASGKILKRELVQWVASGRLQPDPVRYRTPKP